MAQSRNEHRREDAVDLYGRDVYREPASGTITIAHIVYALHTLSILTGLVTAGLTIAGAFVFSWPSILAVVINYIFRSDARATYLESHFSWQINTFWFALLWLVVIYLVGMPLMMLGIGIFVFIIGLLVLGIWVAYRIFAGWRRLARHEPIPF